MSRLRPPSMALWLVLATNLVPVWGVLFAGWDGGQILLLYWTESLILGLLTLPRLFAVAGKLAMGVWASLFFCAHYGLFSLVHLAFLLKLTGPDGASYAQTLSSATGHRSFWLSVGAITLLALVGQWRDWWRPGLWRTSNVPREIIAPYGRVIVLHLAVLISAVMILSFDTPAVTVLILCAIKTVIETMQTRQARPNLAS